MQTVKKFINAVRSGGSLLILTAAILVGQDLALAHSYRLKAGSQPSGWHWPAREEEMGLHTQPGAVLKFH